MWRIIGVLQGDTRSLDYAHPGKSPEIIKTAAGDSVETAMTGAAVIESFAVTVFLFF